MKCTGAIFCLVVGLAAVKAFSVAGFGSFNTTGVSAGGSLSFPRNAVPDARVRSLFGHSTTIMSTNTNTNTNNMFNRSLPLTRSSNIIELFGLPSPQSLIHDFSSAAYTSNAQISKIPELTELSELESIPGLSSAIAEAREHVTQALQLGTNFTAGIEQAIQDAFSSDDPTAALRSIVQTIVNAYLGVAENCPLMIIGSRVLQEGIRLAIEVARSAENVLIGTTTAVP